MLRSRSDEPTHIVLVTCREWPTLSTSDALLAEELTERGHRVGARPWNDTPLWEFAAADAIVLRSNWDYHHDMARFRSWLTAIEASGVVALNPVELVRTTLDKGEYLAALGAHGVRTPRTLAVRLDGDADSSRRASAVPSWADRFDLDRVVVKPVHGASGHDVELVDRSRLDEAVRRRSTGVEPRSFLVQEFLPRISDGEVSLVFFDGRFSHAFRRTPASGDFRVNGGCGGSTAAEPTPDAEMVEFAERAVHALVVTPTYARVDLVGGRNDEITLMELEVNEPALGLHLAPGAAARFADAVQAAMRASG